LKYLDDLKKTLKSATGAIYYNCFPELRDGKDFEKKYGSQPARKSWRSVFQRMFALGKE